MLFVKAGGHEPMEYFDISRQFHVGMAMYIICFTMKKVAEETTTISRSKKKGQITMSIKSS